jgi:glycosyltransferase involved in cell wall biosynthesis
VTIKTLHLTNSWHEHSGGIATFYRALIEAANRKARHIRLVVPGERDSVENAGPFGKIYRVEAPRAPFNSQYRMIYPAQFLPGGSKLQKILMDERPDLVEICDKYTLNYLGAVLRRRLLPALDLRPVVVGLSCERMDDNFRSYLGSLPLAKRFCAAYVKWVYFPFFDHHIANSEYTAEELRIASIGHLTPRNTWIRPMGIDLTHLSPLRRSEEIRQKLRQSCGGNDKSLLLLYAGRLAPEKNLPLLFHTMSALTKTARHDFRLLVAGDGMERNHWESFCRKHIPGKVSFLGHIKAADRLADLLANSDVFIHPNPREPFGIAPLEAMASGLPLVAPNSGGVTSYATLENAWLAPPDTESFATAVHEVVTNGSVRACRVQNALRTAQQFRWESVAASFLDLYAQLCDAASETTLIQRPDFCSVQAKGRADVWSRRISYGTERAFRLISQFLDRPA